MNQIEGVGLKEPLVSERVASGGATRGARGGGSGARLGQNDDSRSGIYSRPTAEAGPADGRGRDRRGTSRRTGAYRKNTVE